MVPHCSYLSNLYFNLSCAALIGLWSFGFLIFSLSSLSALLPPFLDLSNTKDSVFHSHLCFALQHTSLSQDSADIFNISMRIPQPELRLQWAILPYFSVGAVYTKDALQVQLFALPTMINFPTFYSSPPWIHPLLHVLRLRAWLGLTTPCFLCALSSLNSQLSKLHLNSRWIRGFLRILPRSYCGLFSSINSRSLLPRTLLVGQLSSYIPRNSLPK